MSDLSVDFLRKGLLPSAGLSPLIDGAERALARVTDERKQRILGERIGQVRRGAFDVLLVSDMRGPAGFVAVKPMGQSAQLSFGYALPAAGPEAGAILEAVTVELIGRGFESVSSIFNWPAPGAFLAAAEAAGFVRVDRIDMIRTCETCNTTVLPAGITMAPWSEAYFDDVARLLFENVFPEDRVIDPLSRSLDGCRVHVHNIMSHLYGQLMPELCSIAHCDGRPVGVLLATAWPEEAVLVAELAVDGGFQGRGIASAMIGRVIRDGVAAGKKDVRLTVTKSNRTAFSLYRRMGFVTDAEVGYYVYDPRA